MTMHLILNKNSVSLTHDFIYEFLTECYLTDMHRPKCGRINGVYTFTVVCNG